MKETFDFISSIISSLAWPITVILIVLLLKQPLLDLLKRIGKLKIKDIEADFSKEISDVKEEAKVANLLKEDMTLIKGKKTVKYLYEEVETIAHISPEAAISFAWIRVESAIMELVIQSNISPDYPFYNSVIKNINLLREHNDIDQKTIDVVESLRRLRNEVLHRYPFKIIHVTYNDALDYGRLAKGIIDKMDSLY